MKRVLVMVAIVGLAGIAWSPPAAAQVVQTPLDPAGIPKFVNQLPELELGGKPNGKWKGGLPVLDGTTPSVVSICEYRTQILPTGTIDTVTGAAVPVDTYVWGYQIGDVCQINPGHPYIGPVVVAKRGAPTQITFINQLGDTWGSNVLAYTQNTDQTMHWADPLNAEWNQCAKNLSMYGGAPNATCALNYAGPIPAAVHLHGGEIPPNLDGGPDSWFTADGMYRGHGYYTREVMSIPTNPPSAEFALGSLVRYDNDPSPDFEEWRYFRNDGTWTEIPGTEVDRVTYVYPNTQEAANIWFHDHVLGFTRLNVYAGIAGAYVITDLAHTNPDLGPVTDLVPLVIQDRMFDTNGQLYFTGFTTDEHPYWQAEFIGDVAVVNGVVWPKMKVEPKRYRFLFLNGSNSVGYNLQVATPGAVDPVTGAFIYGTKGPDMWVIGTDGGYLDTPAAAFEPGEGQVDGIPTGSPVGDRLVLLPGERYEVIIDFTNYAGQILEMQNDAWNPYPFGDAPPIPQIMQFEVKSKAKSPGVAFDPTVPGVSPRVGGDIVDLSGLAESPDVYRQLTLNEVPSPITDAPLEALLNNSKWDGFQVDERVGPPHSILPRAEGDFTLSGDYSVPTYYSEIPDEGTMEVWDIINITADAHPIHLHLVQFQILERIPFDDVAYLAHYESSFPGGEYLPGYGPPFPYTTANADGALGGNPSPFQAQFAIGASARGPQRGPAAHEVGWKDTAVMYPGEVTRIAVRFAPTDIPNTETNLANLGYPFDPDDGHGYVWHCHILDHEDNEMMRPTEVLTNELFSLRQFIQGVHY